MIVFFTKKLSCFPCLPVLVLTTRSLWSRKLYWQSSFCGLPFPEDWTFHHPGQKKAIFFHNGTLTWTMSHPHWFMGSSVHGVWNNPQLGIPWSPISQQKKQGQLVTALIFLKANLASNTALPTQRMHFYKAVPGKKNTMYLHTLIPQKIGNFYKNPCKKHKKKRAGWDCRVILSWTFWFELIGANPGPVALLRKSKTKNSSPQEEILRCIHDAYAL